ncbi:hypothetical protein OJ997_15095 [Solirubrobacter phytolaccae]|uniref:Uncharacterized protein n=1 Tax=Solirubrobacter phytolaccae TaxID=1404360 RepID=A0A9X3N809_9ACTN|nr:hypothetical protein [Solirubrobacter phytolaccae]MDA0181630.1 hypothetical protein [Solirubrobacter phytolaccae]
MSKVDLEAPRELRKPGDTDAVTFSWADVDAGLYGLARVATGMGGDGEVSSSALAVGFLGRETLGAIVTSPAEDLQAVTDEPLARWTLRGAGELDFELTFEALTAPVGYSGRQALVKAGGMEGYEQLCRVTGTMEGRSVDGLGQRGRAWGNPDWDKIVLTRAVGAWFDDGTGVALGLVRSTKAAHHADEAAWGASFSAEESHEVDEVRLSTTTDEDARQIRAGLELYLDKDAEYPYRGMGEVLTGSTLELGALRMDVAFFRWHIEGRTGIGRYDLIRRTA